MNCDVCGAALDADHARCPACGELVLLAGQQETLAEAELRPPPLVKSAKFGYQRAPARSAPRAMRWILLLAALLGLLGVVRGMRGTGKTTDIEVPMGEPHRVVAQAGEMAS